MRTVRHLAGTLRSVHNTHRNARRTGQVIRRKHTAHPQYYAMTLWGYKWVRKLDDATVFYEPRLLRAELAATDMTIYCFYEIIET